MESTTYLSRAQAATYLTNRGLRISKQTLAKLASIGGGPEYQVFGSRLVVYSEQALIAWAASRLSKPRRSTSEAVAA